MEGLFEGFIVGHSVGLDDGTFVVGGFDGEIDGSLEGLDDGIKLRHNEGLKP